MTEKLNVAQKTISFHLKAMGPILKILRELTESQQEYRKISCKGYSNATKRSRFCIESSLVMKKRNSKFIFLADKAPPHRTNATPNLVESYDWKQLNNTKTLKKFLMIAFAAKNG